jgi:predicted DNA-binding transcriptional regulator AlpA
MESNEAVWLTASQLTRRFGISQMSLWRWLQDPRLNFPAPVQIRERNYWRLDEIVAWEREAAAKSAARRDRA